MTSDSALPPPPTVAKPSLTCPKCGNEFAAPLTRFLSFSEAQYKQVVHDYSEAFQVCPKCQNIFNPNVRSAPAAHSLAKAARSPKSKKTAVVLAVFLGFWTWAYTYKRDAWKFWVNLGLTIVTFGFYGIAAWLWAIIDASRRPQEFYLHYPVWAPSTAAVVIPQRRKSTYEQHLKSEFGFTHGKGGWGFEGGKTIDNMVAQLSEPDSCIGVLKGIREKIPFSQVCIFFNPAVTVLICNTKPTPTCLVTGLHADGIASLVAAAAMEGGQVEVHENGPWLLTL